MTKRALHIITPGQNECYSLFMDALRGPEQDRWSDRLWWWSWPRPKVWVFYCI